jgi:hypothetical protein
MPQRFIGLWHEAVIRCHNEDSNISCPGSAGTHVAESSVTGGVDKSDQMVLVLDLIGTDMLGNAAGFTRDNIGFSNGIKKGRFAMVNVPEDTDNRRTLFQLYSLFLGNFGLLLFSRLSTFPAVADFKIKAVLAGNLNRHRLFQGGIHGSENPQLH